MTKGPGFWICLLFLFCIPLLMAFQAPGIALGALIKSGRFWWLVAALLAFGMVAKRVFI